MDDYFDYCQPECIYVALDGQEYCGAVVVEEYETGKHYLDKVVTKPAFKGNGIATTLWDNCENDLDNLTWRCNPENQKGVEHYYQICDGLQKNEDWIVYWEGLNPDEIKEAIHHALNKKPTLIGEGCYDN